ncbi:hypothetical protein T484DRAFT_2742548, partial [Baffinella frigidus]
QKISVAVHDDELPRAFSCIGTAEFDLASLLGGTVEELWLPFHSEAKAQVMSPCALNLKPETRNTKHETRNTKHETRNPGSET